MHCLGASRKLTSQNKLLLWVHKKIWKTFAWTFTTILFLRLVDSKEPTQVLVETQVKILIYKLIYYISWIRQPIKNSFLRQAKFAAMASRITCLWIYFSCFYFPFNQCWAYSSFWRPKRSRSQMFTGTHLCWSLCSI